MFAALIIRSNCERRLCCLLMVCCIINPFIFLHVPLAGYTQLARPFGRSVVISDSFTADNGWVVPHNRYLLLKYNAHVNVEVSASITAVQYLYSYITKGNRPVVASVHCNDEIKSFSETRVTSSAQAIWQTLGLTSHKQSPTVIRLGVHTSLNA